MIVVCHTSELLDSAGFPWVRVKLTLSVVINQLPLTSIFVPRAVQASPPSAQEQTPECCNGHSCTRKEHNNLLEIIHAETQLGTHIKDDLNNYLVWDVSLKMRSKLWPRSRDNCQHLKPLPPCRYTQRVQQAGGAYIDFFPPTQALTQEQHREASAVL